MIEKFRQFYSQWYSPDEWKALEKALLEPPAKVPCPGFSSYLMDAASLIPVEVLAPQPGEAILDLCAAPGGKSLSIIHQMKFRGKLYCNDASLSRLKRMQNLFWELKVPLEQENWQIHFSHESGRAFAAHSKIQFDRILVDAPCSSESHVLRDPKELKKWSSSRSVLLAKRQRKLLIAALQALKPGGRLVYATCSVSPLENDEVVKWVVRKLGEIVKIKETSHILPHRDKTGPMYMALLEKI